MPILNGTEKQKHTLTGFSSDIECTDKKEVSKNNESSIYLSLEGSSTYFLSVTLILLASILGAILNHIRRHIPEAKNSTSDKDTEQEIGLSNSYLGAFANGLGAGIALVVLIGFIAGLFYHRFYEALKKKTDDAANKLSDKEKKKKEDTDG